MTTQEQNKINPLRKYYLAYTNATTILGGLIHALAHATMTVLLFPFGSRITGIHIVAGPGEKYVFSGSVYSQNKYRVCQFMVAMAPTIFYLLFLVLFFTNGNLTVLILNLCIEVLLPSKADLDNAKAALGMAKANVVSSKELDSMLNTSLAMNQKMQSNGTINQPVKQ